MDSIPSRKTRGRARNDSSSHVIRNQSQGIQPGQPQQQGIYIPRPRQPCVYIPQPRQPAGVSMIRMPNWSNQPNKIRAPLPQVLSPDNIGEQCAVSTHIVEPLSNELNNSSSDKVVRHQTQEEKNTSIPIGRREVRAPQIFKNNDKSYFRIPRPISSQNGKQGAGGETVDLITNYFPVENFTNWSLYKYRVDFCPQEENIKVKRGLLRVHQNLLGGYLFDGTSLYSGTKYASEKFELTSNRDFDNQIVIIIVSFISEMPPNDCEMIQVSNILLRLCMRNLGLVQIGRNYYDEKAKIELKSHKLQILPGFKITIGMFDNGLLVRVEMSTKIMREETILDFFHECRKKSSYKSNWMDDFKKEVIGMIVLTRYNNLTYLIHDIDDQSTPKSTFIKNGAEETYLNYYKEKWGVTIRDCNQPMLISKKKKTFFNGDDEILIYLVPELCTLTGFSNSMRDNYALMKVVSDHTRVDPTKRIMAHNAFLNRIQTDKKSNEILTDWNLSINKQPVEIKGRVLLSEKLFCNNTHYDSGANADWTLHVRSQPFYKSVIMKQWIILYPSQYANDVKPFFNTLRSVGDGMSFRLPQPEFLGIQSKSNNDYLKSLEQIINQMNPSLIVCVIEFSKRNDLYCLIKRKLCVDRAVPTQVVLSRNFQKRDKSVCTKIAIQINSKLGGAPWMVNIPRKGLMIVGFDVCHDIQKNRSYGAIVASINDDCSVYYSNAQPHHNKEEISSRFVSFMTLALHAYKNLNKTLPTSIIIYRDGVGVGQISHVHKIEVAGIKEACAVFYEDKEVPLAFIIVNKRIDTRFFLPTQGGFLNPKPGTIVDTVVTDPTMYDFFLVSQNVRIGTVTPTHYNVIVDTLPHWSPRIMQSLTFKLTHMYYNWSGTIRVPAHCQYAHKLAFLAGKVLGTSPNVALSNNLYFL